MNQVFRQKGYLEIGLVILFTNLLEYRSSSVFQQLINISLELIIFYTYTRLYPEEQPQKQAVKRNNSMSLYSILIALIIVGVPRFILNKINVYTISQLLFDIIFIILSLNEQFKSIIKQCDRYYLLKTIQLTSVYLFQFSDKGEFELFPNIQMLIIYISTLYALIIASFKVKSVIFKFWLPFTLNISYLTYFINSYQQRLYQIFIEEKMVQLVIYGLVIVPIGVLSIAQIHSLKIFRLIVIRKFFHYYFVLFLGPCILYPYVTQIIFALSSAMYFWFELHRLYYKNFAAIYITNLFGKFTDHRDDNGLIISHLSLFFSSTFPLVYSQGFLNRYTLFQGLLGINIIGAGDASAACIGSVFGKYKIFGNKKTFEGTLACFISIIFVHVIFALLIEGFSSTSLDLVEFAKAIIVYLFYSLGEAYTFQNDNFIMPILSWLLSKYLLGN